MVEGRPVLKKGGGAGARLVASEARAGGGASSGYRLRRCDEENGKMPRCQSVYRFRAERQSVHEMFIHNVKVVGRVTCWLLNQWPSTGVHKKLKCSAHCETGCRLRQDEIDKVIKVRGGLVQKKETK
jgi:hypothetical protein